MIEGSDLVAGGRVDLRAAGNIDLLATANYESTSWSKVSGNFLKKKRTSYSKSELTHDAVSITSDGGLIKSGRDITAPGLEMTGKDDIVLSAKRQIHIGAYKDVSSETLSKSTSYVGGLAGHSRFHSVTIADMTGGKLLSGADLTLVTKSGDIILEGTTVRAAGKQTIKPGSGKLVMKSITDVREDVFSRSRNNGVVAATTTRMIHREQAQQVSIEAGSYDLSDVEKLELDLSFESEAEAEAYVEKLPEAFKEIQKDINYTPLTNNETVIKQKGLAPAFKALVTAAVGNWVGGWAALEGMTATKAFVSSMMVSGLDGLVAGKIDIGEILKNATFSAVSAGLADKINLDTFNIDLGDTGALRLLGDNLTVRQILEGWLDNTVSAALSSAVYKVDFWDAMTDGMKATIVSLALADVQKQIGDLGLKEGSAGHAGLHALAGCMAAEARGADCAAGGIAGALQSVYSGALDADGTILSDREQQQRANLIGAIAGYVASGGKAENVSVAAHIALSGMVHNRQMHRSEIVWLRENAAAFAKQQGISYDEALRRLTVQAASQVDARYSGPIDEGAAKFLFEHAPVGVIPGTAGDGSHIDHNQTWFSSTQDQFKNHLINLASITFDPDIHLALEDFRAAGGGDPAVFIATRLMEGAGFSAFDDLSPEALLDTVATATAQFRAVLEGDYSSTQKLMFAEAFGFALNNGLSLRGFSPSGHAPDGFTEAEAAQLQAYYDLTTAVRVELEPLLAAEGSRLSDDVARGLLGSFRKNHLSQIKVLGKSATDRIIDGIWDQRKYSPIQRGNAIENHLAATDYSGWTRVGSQSNGFSPAWDFNQGSTWVSLKTVDTMGGGWYSSMRSHIDELQTWSSPNSSTIKVLDIRVQPGGSVLAQSLIDYGAARGVQVRINEF